MANTLTKADFMREFAERLKMSQHNAGAILDTLAAIVAGNLEAGREVSLPGLARFALKDRAARTGRNPHSGLPVEIPARTVITIKPAKALRDRVA